MDALSEDFIGHFSTMADPRIDNKNKLHQLLDIVTLMIIAVICGADGYADVEVFGKNKLNLLRKIIPLNNGIPSHDTIGDLFARINPDEFRSCFLSWVNSIKFLKSDDVVAIDGKTVCGSSDKINNQSAIHMVSAWCEANQLVLGQIKTEEKSNEITAIPKLLKLLDITKSIVTIDAMGCQRNIADQIIKQEAEYILAVKGNQGSLHESIKKAFKHAADKKFEDIVHDQYIEENKGHGRIEKRSCYVLPLMYAPMLKLKWKHLKSLVKIESHVVRDGTSYLEERYYISSIELDAKLIGQSIRKHWSIENKLHWCLDVVFNEDNCRAREGNSAENFSIVRHIVLNLLKQNKGKKTSLKATRKKAGWNDEYLLELLQAL